MSLRCLDRHRGAPRHQPTRSPWTHIWLTLKTYLCVIGLTSASLLPHLGIFPCWQSDWLLKWFHADNLTGCSNVRERSDWLTAAQMLKCKREESDSLLLLAQRPASFPQGWPRCCRPSQKVGQLLKYHLITYQLFKYHSLLHLHRCSQESLDSHPLLENTGPGVCNTSFKLLLTIVNHCWTLFTIVHHCWPLLTIVDQTDHNADHDKSCWRSSNLAINILVTMIPLMLIIDW